MYDKRFYSMKMTRALLDNGALTMVNWPEDLATPDEAEATWPFQNSTGKYLQIKENLPDLKVLLLFAAHGHVNPMPDVPQVHQAWEGYRKGCGFWVRLGADESYVKYTSPDPTVEAPDHDANTEPDDWAIAYTWGHQNTAGFTDVYPLAAVAEMADRVHEDNWDTNLDDVLVPGPEVILAQ